MRRGFLVLLLAILIQIVQSAATDTLDSLPPWNYEELVASATRGMDTRQLKSVRLLAWHTQEDGRPVRYDAALLWIHFSSSSGQEKWALVIMDRNPLDAPLAKRWTPSYQGHSWKPVAIFDSPPRNKDVYKFIEGHWKFEPDSSVWEGIKLTDGQWRPVRTAGFRILAGAVRVRTWRDAVGEAPVRFHRGEEPSGK